MKILTADFRKTVETLYGSAPEESIKLKSVHLVSPNLCNRHFFKYTQSVKTFIRTLKKIEVQSV